MKQLLSGVLLLVGVLLIHRGLHKPQRPVFDLALWRAKLDSLVSPDTRNAVEQGISDGALLGSAIMDGDQGGWPTHNGQEAGA